MRRLRFSITAGTLLAAASAGGCSFEAACEGEACVDPLGQLAEPAMAHTPLNPWPIMDGELRLCIKSDGTLSSAEYAAGITFVVDTLNAGWGKVPGLRFANHCDGGPDTVLYIKLVKMPGGGGSCWTGRGADCTIGIDPSNPTAGKNAIIHEVGHGLGMAHEHQRPGVALCQYEQSKLDNCRKCSNAQEGFNEACTLAEAIACFGAPPANSSVVPSAAFKALAVWAVQQGQPSCQPCSTGFCQIGCSGCTATATFWGCFGADPTPDTIIGDVVISAGDRGAAAGVVDNRAPIPSGLLLTQYDPLSVMNYCRAEYGAVDDGIPTVLDLLGMEMLYSTDRVYRLGCGQGCFSTGSGVVTTRSGTVVSEWIERGSLNVPFRAAGSSDVYFIPANGLPDGTSTLNYTFRDPNGNPRSGSGTVTRSNSAFMAIAQAASEDP